jgi:bifunctional non-homologous end joining protein LigD
LPNHLSKALWPETKSSRALTKRDLLRYYAAVAEEMLPFLKDRPISFVRHPDGIGEPGFFQKHPLPGMPDFVSTVKIWTDHSSKALDWILCDNLETLMWLGQVGTVEIHPWYSRIAPGTNPKLPVEFESADGLDASALDYPDFIVLDLDPNIEGSAKELGQARGFDRQAWDQSTRVALALRELLQTIGLDSLVKSSGKTGLHVYVPIERRYHYDQVKAMAQTLGQQLETQMPDEVTMVWTVKKRPSAVFVDHNQNVRGKTLAAPFSPRVSPSAPVSFPVSWDTLVEFDPTQVTIQTATGNLEKWGNPWRAILDHPQKLNFDVLS